MKERFGLSSIIREPTIEYEVEKTPNWYVQGSYVLDKIFQKNCSRDIDIFLPNSQVKPPSFKEKKFNHIVDEWPEGFYFPPRFGCYNTDKYLLTESGIICPKNFPKKPTELEVLDTRLFTIEEILKGLKTSLRYELPPTEKTEVIWSEVIREHFNPEWMKALLFDSEQEVVDYINDFIFEETGERERKEVKKTIEKLLGRSLS